MYRLFPLLFLLFIVFLGCNSNKETKTVDDVATQELSCCNVNSKSRFFVQSDSSEIAPQTAGTEGMVFIKGGTFEMGADNNQARPDEYPKHPVEVNSFWMDEHEVTNAQFKKFVDETGYVTEAEKDVDWEVMKTQVPPGTAKPPAEMLKAGSMVFTPPSQAVPLNDYSQWWS
ncbi:MAG TPA: SUMF1/EgtB/PvdO family nonheme iron enzyme, partial [Draconibacterium sp.]|nr:SUMF1/EgtB/PvdO family nonheme iron enzyme [Draconibacterium sp.]